MNDNHATARHLDFREYVGRKQNGMLFTKVFDQLPDLADLIWIETDCRFIENKKIGLVQERIGQANTLAVTFRERAD